MSTNMDGPQALIEEVLDLPVADLQTLFMAVVDRLRPFTASVQALAATLSQVQVPEARFDVLLVGVNQDMKIQSIKAVREASTVGGHKPMGLMEAKSIVDHVIVNNVHSWVRTTLLIEEAEECCQILARSHCTGLIQPH
jgi:ribosomal protein L7/L12